jgi:hypothetical protein
MDTDEWLIIVDNLIHGSRAYRVERWTLNTHLARLEPVFNLNQTIRDYPHATSFRLVHPQYAPEFMVEAARELLINPCPSLANY